MLEFEEFLKIIKGNPAAQKKNPDKPKKHKHDEKSDASGAIY